MWDQPPLNDRWGALDPSGYARLVKLNQQTEAALRWIERRSQAMTRAVALAGAQRSADDGDLVESVVLNATLLFLRGAANVAGGASTDHVVGRVDIPILGGTGRIGPARTMNVLPGWLSAAPSDWSPVLLALHEDALDRDTDTLLSIATVCADVALSEQWVRSWG